MWHRQIYARWKNTPIADVVGEPREHPEATLPDLSQSNSLVKFAKHRIALVYRSVICGKGMDPNSWA
jgi:hypothetical protein